jgi:hypothetical protein
MLFQNVFKKCRILENSLNSKNKTRINIIFKKRFFIRFVILINIIIFLLFFYIRNNNEFNFKIFKHKSLNNNVCEINLVMSEEIVEIFTIAAKIDIKLFIVELQRLYGFLKEEEIEFIEEREFLSVIERNYKPNKTILGIFQSNFSQNQRVR